MANDELTKFQELSREIGENILYVQGAGGNTSIKLDRDTMLVKASGKWLSDAGQDNVFVAVGWAQINRNIAEGRADALENSQVEGRISALRPSIETTLHSQMPHKVVVHTHSVNTIVHAVLDDARTRIARKLDGMNWAFIPYSKPGVTLTKLVTEALVDESPDILVIQNHGLVIGADNAADAYARMLLVEDCLDCAAKSVPVPDGVGRQDACASTAFKFADSDLTNQLAYNKIAIKVATAGSLFPDHVVFLGSGLVEFDSADKGIEYLQTDTDDPLRCKAVIITGAGVIHHRALSANGIEMLKAIAAVATRIPERADLKYLTESEELELVNWDAEKYRKALEKS
jgi:rhamnose utilization protein RhaD (predicted bifunctional aldolase and dehydrogenase)